MLTKLQNIHTMLYELESELEALQKCNKEIEYEYRRCREVNHHLQDKLEALQAPKTCNECDCVNNCEIIEKCKVMQEYFFCSDWKPKDK